MFFLQFLHYNQTLSRRNDGVQKRWDIPCTTALRLWNLRPLGTQFHVHFASKPMLLVKQWHRDALLCMIRDSSLPVTDNSEMPRWSAMADEPPFFGIATMTASRHAIGSSSIALLFLAGTPQSSCRPSLGLRCASVKSPKNPRGRYYRELYTSL